MIRHRIVAACAERLPQAFGARDEFRDGVGGSKQEDRFEAQAAVASQRTQPGGTQPFPARTQCPLFDHCRRTPDRVWSPAI